MAARQSGPVAWFTAQTLTCVARMGVAFRQLLHVDALEGFRGSMNGGVPMPTSWDRVLDTDVGDPAAGGRTLKDVLDERMIGLYSNLAGGACVP